MLNYTFTITMVQLIILKITQQSKNSQTNLILKQKQNKTTQNKNTTTQNTTHNKPKQAKQKHNTKV